MQTFQYKDLVGRLGVDDSSLKDFVKTAEIEFSWDNSPWLAGGALRRTLNGEKLDSDFDIFFKNEEKYKECYKLLTEDECLITEPTRETDTAVWVKAGKYNINLIKIYHPTAKQLIDSFDFTICQIVSDLKTVGLGDFTLWDLGRKRLAINEITFPVASMRRMYKYMKQGYYACPGVMQDFLTRISQRPELINAQFNYID